MGEIYHCIFAGRRKKFGIEERQQIGTKVAKKKMSLMKLREVKDILKADLVVGGDKVLEEEVYFACGSDLMSDVLAFVKPGALLLTGLTNLQSVRTAEIAELKAIVYVRGKKPDETAVKLAREKGIPLLSTKLRMFEACGRLYSAGLRGVEEVEELLAANK